MTFLNSLVFSGITSSLSENESRKIKLTNQICLILFFASCPYSFIFYFMGLFFLSKIVVFVIFTFFFCIILNKFHFFNSAKFGIILSTCLAIIFYSSSLGKESGIQLLCLILVVAPMVIFDMNEKIKVIIGGLIPILSWVLLEWTNYSVVERVAISGFYLNIIYFIACFLIVVINILMIRFYYISNKQAEDALLKSNQELKIAYQDLKSAKSAAEGLALQSSYATLVRGIAHEIKNPLQILAGRAYVVLQDLDDKEGIKKFAEVIMRNIERLSKLIHSMLEYGASSGRDKENFCICKVIDDIIELSTHNSKENGIAMSGHWTESLQVCGNKVFIYQALLNLVVNAIQYTPRGGKITLTCTRKEGEVEIAVSDTGVSISEENMKQIFMPYFTLKAKPENTGLGLSMAFKTFAENDGRLDVQSEVGVGTTFLAYLPLVG